jgi:phosphomannomutase/phosphoglucomutase
MNPNVFREYDIRGLVGIDFSDSDITRLGRAMGTYMLGKGAKTITMGRDCRLSADQYRGLLLEGLLSTGLSVIDVGTCPTPVLYFSVPHYKADGGVMITASHNPPEYNGFKMLVGKTTIFGSAIQEIKGIIETGSFAKGKGTVAEKPIIEPYIDYVANNIKLERPVKLAVDGGNGTAGPVAIPLMERLGLHADPIYCDMDGRFPNHEPDPTVPDNLRDLAALVTENGYELGVAYDGDSDRLGVVDEKGQVIYGDMLLAIFARAILAENPGSTFIAEVKCSKNLFDDIRKQGGNPIMWRTGHSLIKDKMQKSGALLAGEMSGHMFFKHRWFGFDDGIYASLRLVELVSRTNQPLSTWLEDLPPVVNTPEIRVECPDEIKFAVVEQVKKDLTGKCQVIDVDGVRVDFPDGWGLVRASNTQPVLVSRFEAQSHERLEQIRELVENAISVAKEKIA